MTDATLTAAEGVGEVRIEDRGTIGIPRVIYLFENRGVQPQTVDARALSLVENKGVEPLEIVARSLYLYENLAVETLVVLSRSLYGYEQIRDGEVYPWLMAIVPGEQYRGGTVELYGDGFGEILEVAGDLENTITTSSVSGGNIGANAVDRTTAEWISTSGAGAWIRFAFAGPRTVVGVALEDLAGVESWGIPLFRFSDGGADVVGATDVPKAGATTRSAEYPVGGARLLYALPTPRTTDYVEIRVSSGGTGTNRGLGEVWIYTDTDETAEGSSPILNDGLVSETALGIVAWRNRSPGLWPANGGLPITPAATATVPADAESGLVVIEETI